MHNTIGVFFAPLLFALTQKNAILSGESRRRTL
jgi:hypothetical protein